ncbi:MAG: hypothetical protein RL318_458 [Fibrobacterota bacterium]|jgi:predicted AAA+ superfamily ATPase
MSETFQVRQQYLETLDRWRGTPLIKVLTGMRRVGKSVLLQLWRERLGSLHGIPSPQILMIERDSLEHAGMDSWLELRAVVEPWLETPGPKHLLIDEVQLIDGWEKVVNALHKRGDVDIVLTGSNAHLLSSELATLLSGRWIGILVLPFSYAETLEIRKQAHSQVEFERWLRLGGMPTLHHMTDDPQLQQQTLEAIHSTVLLRDVVARHEIRNVALLERIERYHFDQIGSLVNPKRISDFFKSQHIKVSVDTVQTYLHHLEGACVLHRVKRYDLRGRRHLEIHEKIYATDLGLRNALLRRGLGDIGVLLENVVFLELIRRGYTVDIGKVGDWEIDFVATRNGAIEYFQVCYLLAEPATVEREFRSLLAIDDNHPKTILSLDPIDLSRDGIRHRHLAEWLLEETPPSL